VRPRTSPAAQSRPRIGSPSLWLALLSALAVLGLVAKNLDRATPGSLALVHHREEDLSSRSGCAGCHGGNGVTMAEACRECHADIAAQIDAGAGLHGSLDPRVAQGCSLCHSEHHGKRTALVNARSFALAGVPDVLAFDHARVGFEMHGKHLELDCAECHALANEKVLEKGQRRYLGLAQDCKGCHEDPHSGRIARACADCHDQSAFNQFPHYIHDQRFSLQGAHAEAACVECHQNESAHSVEALGGLEPAPAWRECRDCHSSPHQDAFVELVAQLAGATTGASCAGCHDAVHQGFRDQGVTITPAQHAFSGFALDPPHDQASCGDCHPAETIDFASRYPGRGQSDCRACHLDAHRGFFEARAQAQPEAASACASCHGVGALSFAHVPDFDHRLSTGFALNGAHEQSACESCHPRAEHPDELGRTLGLVSEHFGPIQGCVSCHLDPHRGMFDAEHLPAQFQGKSDCARCHQESSFRNLAQPFDHFLWTKFRLRGAHAQIACSECHPPLERPDAFGRTWAAAAGTDCQTCHADPHAGQFVVDGRTDCQSCHQTTSFHELDFDHNKDSRFPLDEAHAPLDCAACHRPWIQNGVEVVRYKPLGMECTDCHGVNRSALRPKRGKR
jgi:hypothetical protein